MMDDATTTGTAERTEGAGRRQSALVYCAYCEFVRLLREPMFVLPIFLFPILFFAMFGLPNVDETLGGVGAGRYTMVSYGTYAVMSAALFSFGVTVAAERKTGWNHLLRTTPLRASTVFAAKGATAVAFGVSSLACFFAFGAVVGGVEMPLGLWVGISGPILLGMLPFVALGFLIGYVSGPNSAAAVANLIFLPLAFGSGLFLPLELLPEVVRSVAPYLPSYHVAQLGWHALGAGDGAAPGTHVLWVLGYTAAFLALATAAYRRDEGQNFG